LGEKQNLRIKALAIVLRALSNETRLKIMNMLNKNPRTWTQIQLELKINAKSLRDHLNYLRNVDLVKRSDPKGFELTPAGKMVLEISMKDILAVIELET